MRSFQVRNDKNQTFEVDEDKIQKAEADGYLPVVTNGKEEHRVSFADLPKAQADGYAPTSPPVPASEEPGFFGRMARNTVDTLPLVGGAAGGMLALPVGGPVGAVAGAAAGGMAGSELKQYIDQYFPERAAEMATKLKDKSGLDRQLELQKQPLAEGGKMALAEMGGQAASAFPGYLTDQANSAATKMSGVLAKNLGSNLDNTPIANKAEMEKAAENLKLDLPSGFLTSNPTIRDAESALSQSGSFAARETRNKYDKFFNDFKDKTSALAEMQTPDSGFKLGSQIQEGMADQVGKMRAPTTDLYQSVVPDLQKIPVNTKIVNKVFGELKSNPIFQTKAGQEFLAEHRGVILAQPELNSLKEYRTTLNQNINQNTLPIDEARITAIRNATTQIRDNTIEATKASLPTAARANVDHLTHELALADASHASTISDINSVKRLVGNKDVSSSKGFLRKLSDTPEVDVSTRAANLDVKSLGNLKDKFPDVFEKAKQAKINDMIDRSTKTKGFEDHLFFKEYRNLEPEVKDLLFDKSTQAQIDDLATIKTGTPSPSGPSGTPKGQRMLEMIDPRRNALDYATKKALDARTKVNVPKQGLLPEQTYEGPVDDAVLKKLARKKPILGRLGLKKSLDAIYDQGEQ